MPDDLIREVPSYTELGLRFLIDIIAISLLARGIYYPLHRKKEYLFTFFLFNVLIFLICLLLSSARLQVGFAFGLFAVFSMIRYRTVTIPVKEMGYFFVCVAMALINALVSAEQYYLLPLSANVAILVMVLLMDKYVMMNGEQMKDMVYERIDLVVPQKRAELLKDLQARTGLNVQRVEVISLDYLRDVAVLQIFFTGKEY